MPIGDVPAQLLSVEPAVFLTGMPYERFLGIAEPFAQRYGNAKAGFLVFPSWSIESRRMIPAIQAQHADHSARYPDHRFLFICNTPKETELLRGIGIPALFLNKNITVSERIFRPIEETPVEFDAVYNARFVRGKHHELTAAVPRVGYITYIEGDLNQEFRTLYPAALARNPDHALLNGLEDGLPARMSQVEVNAAINRAAVGLILSKVEGSNYATMEYLLAGLPVVSTPSRGGRDVFFDPEYCIVCAHDAAAVRDAVAALRARNIPREYIRARTLAKIEPERRRFLTLVDDMIVRLGGVPRHEDGVWPYGEKISGVPWRHFEVHLDEFATRRRAECGADLAWRDPIAEARQS